MTEQAVKRGFGKRQIGLVAGIIVFLLLYLLPIPGLGVVGQTVQIGDVASLGSGLVRGQDYTVVDLFGVPTAKSCLALSLMTVVLWATGVAQNGYTAGLYLALLVVMGVEAPASVFYSWTGGTMWLVIGAYLIANAVKTSGLGERIAYNYMLRFVTDFRSIIIGSFVLTAILSLLIPHPWPRAFLIMAVMSIVIESSHIVHEDAVKIGFSVFAASVPASLIFITGDAVINPLAASYFGGATFLDWFVYMGLPSIIMTVITMLLFLVLFKPTKTYTVNKDQIRERIEQAGPMTKLEKKTAVWLVIAIALWMTDSLHHVDIAWVTFIVGMLMSFPAIGDVVSAKDWSAVPVHVLIFLTAAMAIGKVGGLTGMNSWIADTIFPSAVPSNVFVLALMVAALSIIIHMLLGSVIAVMGVAVPAILTFTVGGDVTQGAAIAWTLICYTAVAAHYMFPFQHLNTLVGASPDTGMYTQRETLRLGVPLIAVVFVVCVGVMVPWLMLLGLL
ncbi:sodium/sulphate symporter [Olsenella uli DSM 7084]|uniref:Sodium/sulphate symporter n=1 Tax=Olsenella uli (strain ATCC 49627 / DSM 7084 / CCUG 31166 / CIP 109912 / JCM 12494 / LMG 11480 / NCIMB 702895 / VPI D76D-27C) TaxID=633147 RepID=E1QWR4_OLSUV|nr:SLC13 family permease [Olsenella uli]ADK68567.1 sodium/sulphate symporter [Olsenella uli DSM 7084]KRO12627.1 sodium sulfate symporter [Olsenella uli DSM 7084]